MLMKTPFLDKFAGKTQTISKLGVQHMLKGQEVSFIYTNTIKSFLSSNLKNTIKINYKQSVSSHLNMNIEQISQHKYVFPMKLPKLYQRYIKSEIIKTIKDKTSSKNPNKVYNDKETNCMFDLTAIKSKKQQNVVEPSINQQSQNNENIISIIPKNINKNSSRGQDIKNKASITLGGLGPNTGSEQWKLLKEKQQKHQTHQHMSTSRFISLMNSLNINTSTFNHFDYAQVFQQLTDIEMHLHPNKKRIVQEFTRKCMLSLRKQEERDRQETYQNFICRVGVYQKIRVQKMEALRFIQEKYDSKNKQLKFYPKINTKKSTQKGKYWKDVDGFNSIQTQQSIYKPNYSTFFKQKSTN